LREKQENSESKTEYMKSRGLATIAREYYDIVDDERYSQNASDLIIKIEEIVKVVELKERADKNYEVAQDYFKKSKYDECELQVQMTLDLYYKVDMINKTAEVYELINKCSIGSNATKAFIKAAELKEEGNYDLAMDYASKARDLYRNIEDIEGSIKSGELILTMESDKKKEELEEKIKGLMQMLMPIVIFALTILMIIGIPASLFIIRYRERIFGKSKAEKGRLEDEIQRIREQAGVEAEKEVVESGGKPPLKESGSDLDSLESNVLNIRDDNIDKKQVKQKTTEDAKEMQKAPDPLANLEDGVMKKETQQKEQAAPPSKVDSIVDGLVDDVSGVAHGLDQKQAPPAPEEPEDLSNLSPEQLSERLKNSLGKIDKKLYKRTNEKEGK